MKLKNTREKELKSREVIEEKVAKSKRANIFKDFQNLWY